MTEDPDHAFPPAELERRLAAVRAAMAARGLDRIVVGVPENIYYLTGLDHWGYFACHLLIVPLDGEMTLTCRAIGRVTVTTQVRKARFVGHADGEDVADFAARALTEAGLAGGRLGLEMRSLFVTPRLADGIRTGLARAEWHDASGLADAGRLVKSPLEVGYMRRAAQAATDGALTAVEAIATGPPTARWRPGATAP